MFALSHVLCLQVRRPNPAGDYVVPGWNDIVSDKHKLARDAYMAWLWLVNHDLDPNIS